MAYRYAGKNTRPFSALCQNNYGREVIYTDVESIDATNVVEELNKALSVHRQNRKEIEYLERYYEGDQPILYRVKKVRPDINNKVVNNIAYMIVEMKTSEISGEPIQYVQHGADESKSEEVAELNVMMNSEDKPYFDIELCRWRSICGTAYRFVGNNSEKEKDLLDEYPFYIETENPKDTFVVYSSRRRDKAMFSCQIRKNPEGKEVYNIYTPTNFYEIIGDKVIKVEVNGNNAIPVIEYPNNARRLSDIEITIAMTDELNTMASDRANGIEQFVASWIKFVNCDVDIETYRQMRQEGALVVKSNNGDSNKADVDVMTSELNQSESQVAVNDQFDKILIIQGLASRQGNTGGDTQGAVELRNGHYDAEKRAELSEPIFIRAERQFIKIILNKMRIKKDWTLKQSDIEVKISRTKMDNMQVKALVLQTLLQCGVNPARAIKTVGLFSDPEQVAIESQKRMDVLYPETVEQGEIAKDVEDGNDGTTV